jgi:hypothetical protein
MVYNASPYLCAGVFAALAAKQRYAHKVFIPRNVIGTFGHYLLMRGFWVQSSKVQSSKVQSSKVQSSKVQSSKVQSSKVQSSRVQSSKLGVVGGE